MKKPSSKRKAQAPVASIRSSSRCITKSKSKQYKILFSKNDMNHIQYNAAKLYLENKNFLVNSNNCKLFLIAVGSCMFIMVLFILRFRTN